MIKPTKYIDAKGIERNFIYKECADFSSNGITEWVKWENGKKVSVEWYTLDWDNDEEDEIYMDEKTAARIIRKLKKYGAKWEHSFEDKWKRWEKEDGWDFRCLGIRDDK